MSTEPGSTKDLREGKFIVVDGEPCKVVEIQTSAPGKHGAAKMRITAVGIFDNTKRTILKPSGADIEVPMVERKVVQVISVSGDIAQIMDPKTFEVYEMPVPAELKNDVEAGKEVEIMETMGRRMMQRVRSSD